MLEESSELQVRAEKDDCDSSHCEGQSQELSSAAETLVIPPETAAQQKFGAPFRVPMPADKRRKEKIKEYKIISPSDPQRGGLNN